MQDKKLPKALTRPHFIREEDAKYFNFFSGLKGYDDEQKLILISMHYNANLKNHFETAKISGINLDGI